ncbi:MAG: tetratricopeptide repeat protein [Gammaproteobacteria bacterium]|nr:tetratricopeptide repeat protein [Gammaproteobacteria bacterium]
MPRDNRGVETYPGGAGGGVETFPGAETYPGVPADRGSVTAPAPAGSPAVIALLDRADQQYQAHDLDAAAASLERALRIEPRNPRLWYQLAAIRLEQGQYGQAIQMAGKSNSLAAGDTRLQVRNWRLIAAARRAQGDAAGARAAEERASRLE